MRSCQYLLRQDGHFHVTGIVCTSAIAIAAVAILLMRRPTELWVRTDPRIGTSVVIVGHGVDERASIKILKKHLTEGTTSVQSGRPMMNLPKHSTVSVCLLCHSVTQGPATEVRNSVALGNEGLVAARQPRLVQARPS